MTVHRYEEIRRRLAEGRSLREIARALGCSRRTVREVRDGQRVSPDAPKSIADPLWMAQLDWPAIIHDLGLGHPLKFLWEERAQNLTTYSNFWKWYGRPRPIRAKWDGLGRSAFFASTEGKMKSTVVGIDIAKRVFQVHWVDDQSGEILSVQLKRDKFLAHFANRASCVIGMEACGGSQHWARELQKLGHDVKLLPARSVKPFAARNKNDRTDARAIWTAMQQPGIKTVAVKTEGQQAILALHRMRSQLVKFRTAQINGLRGLLTEYGEVMAQGRAVIRREAAAAIGRLSERLPAVVIDTLREHFARLTQIDEEVDTIERRLRLWHRNDEASRRIADIPGVGLLTATAAVATIGNAKAFKSGREFAAWVGLVPRQHGTGGRVRLLGISKRGDTYLRTLLTHGARAVITCGKHPPEWALRIVERRRKNVAVVALANKMARTIWALLTHERVYEPQYAKSAA
jgi:transposase